MKFKSDDDGSPGVTKHLARFACETRYEDIPSGVRDLERVHILDALGLALAGARARGSSILRDYLSSLGCTAGPAHVFGTDMMTAGRFAALVNGAAIHAHDYDDTCPQHLADRNGGLHATGPVLSAALAAAEKTGASGRDVLEAFHVGVEIGCRINHAIDNRHYANGYHATGTINVFGAAAAVSRVMRADVDTVRTAFGLAASHAGGIRENFGTMTKPYHAGHAAEGGTVAAELAICGFTAARNALEAPRGYFAAAGGGFDPEQVMDRLGSPWAFEDPGIWIKPHPSGALNHPAMTLLRRYVRENELKPTDVAHVRLRTNANVVNTLLHNDPSDWLEAKFSLPFNAAAILVRGRAGLAEFTDEIVNDPQIRSMMSRIDFSAFDEIGPDFANTTTFVELALTDGRTMTGRVDFPKGSPQDPMSFDDVTEKFRECAEFADWPAQKTERIIELVRGFERLADIRDLTSAMSQ
ncbi:MAG: MmgE/PrpD family protein [Pseudomonadota bacterium]